MTECSMTTPMTKEARTKLRQKAIEAKTVDDWGCDADNFHEQATPDAVLALLDELERKEEQRANWFQMAQKLSAEIDAAEKRIAEQDREIDSLAAVAGSNAAQVKELHSRAESAEQALLLERQKGTAAHPAEFYTVAENIRPQDNRITADPMFCVYQTREIVVDEDYDCDRIVWVDENGREATERQRIRLELLHQNFREPPEKWRRVAVKDIDDFVTCCFTEQGCKDYLVCNGHNLRQPFIYVKGGFRNAEYIGIRNWLAGITLQKGGE